MHEKEHKRFGFKLNFCQIQWKYVRHIDLCVCVSPLFDLVYFSLRITDIDKQIDTRYTLLNFRIDSTARKGTQVKCFSFRTSPWTFTNRSCCCCCYRRLCRRHRRTHTHTLNMVL